MRENQARHSAGSQHETIGRIAGIIAGLLSMRDLIQAAIIATLIFLPFFLYLW